MTAIWKEDGRANSAIITATVLRLSAARLVGPWGHHLSLFFPVLLPVAPPFLAVQLWHYPAPVTDGGEGKGQRRKVRAQSP